ncbi:ethanolamine utilization protein EutJ [Ornithinicoccus hortensis]|uniref:ethanolamine utilization protein EutJ n=1 Tax=Ornithinicoccus hortensis TaxID=82346 RepID=UPI001B871FF9|nr:ethanolamine utilization protein EutJ [Ornithinicoccus hortensis]
MGDRSEVGRLLASARAHLGRAAEEVVAPLRVGVDLGTATCVIVVLDASGDPVWVQSTPCAALQDGVVVDFAGAVAAVTRLREEAERALGVSFTRVATAYPPCVGIGESRACRYVCEQAGFTDVLLVDEVTAAGDTLALRDAVVVDVGGGSTGVGVFRDGRLVSVDDRPGGGHHLDLILAGALGMGVHEAEKHKVTHARESLPLLVPGIERIGNSIRALSADATDLPVHLSGGALMLPGADRVLAGYLDRSVISYPHAHLITPLGIARSAA